MKYTMYHKSLPTITFSLTEQGYVDEIVSIENKEHIHPFLLEKSKIPNSKDNYPLYDKIIRWMAERNIPASRINLASALNTLKVKDTNELAIKSFYLSLSDQYWIAPTESKLDWNKINFFDNNFSEDIGKALFGDYKESEKNPNFHSPDSGTDGRLCKKWIVNGSRRVLVKGGSGTEQLEPFNEILASEIFQRLGIPHVKYSLYIENRKHFSLCDDFVTRNTEFITAASLCEEINGSITYDDFKNCCRNFSINLNEIELGKMFAVDFIIANEDRHLNNFGFLRNADSLEWEGLAPVFDSGTSMFHQYKAFELDKAEGLQDSQINSKPFMKHHKEQLSLFPKELLNKEMDLSLLNGIGNFYKEVLSKQVREIPQSKIDTLCNILDNRVELLKKEIKPVQISIDGAKDCSKKITLKANKKHQDPDDYFER